MSTIEERGRRDIIKEMLDTLDAFDKQTVSNLAMIRKMKGLLGRAWSLTNRIIKEQEYDE
jgi:hypothetical protein